MCDLYGIIKAPCQLKSNHQEWDDILLFDSVAHRLSRLSPVCNLYGIIKSPFQLQSNHQEWPDIPLFDGVAHMLSRVYVRSVRDLYLCS